jgi:hypothetical protein
LTELKFVRRAIPTNGAHGVCGASSEHQTERRFRSQQDVQPGWKLASHFSLSVYRMSFPERRGSGTRAPSTIHILILERANCVRRNYLAFFTR